MKLFKTLGAAALVLFSSIGFSAEVIQSENPNFASTKRAGDTALSAQKFEIFTSGKVKYQTLETLPIGSIDGKSLDLGDGVVGTVTSTSQAVQRPPSFLVYRAIQVSSQIDINLGAVSRGFAMYVIDNDELATSLDVTFMYIDGTSETKQIHNSSTANQALQFFGFVSDKSFQSIRIHGSALTDGDGVFIDNLAAINATSYRDPVTFNNFYNGITSACTQAGTWRNSNDELTLTNGGTISCGGSGHYAGKVKLLTLQIVGDRFVGQGIEDSCWVSKSYSNAPVTTSAPYWRYNTVGATKVSTLYMRSYQTSWVSGRRGSYSISCRIDQPESHNLKLTGSSNFNFSDTY